MAPTDHESFNADPVPGNGLHPFVPPDVVPGDAEAPRLLFGPHDRIVIDGVEYLWVTTDHRGQTLKRLNEPHVVEFFTHARLWPLSGTDRLVHEPDWHSGSKVTVRQLAAATQISELPQAAQADVLWKYEWCTRFMKFEENEEADRGDSMQDAIDKIFADLSKLEIAKKQKNGKTRSGTRVEIRKSPGPRTLCKWLNILEAHDYDPVSLRDRRYGSGNFTCRIEVDVYVLMRAHVVRFADERRPKKKQLFEDFKAALELLNVTRRQAKKEILTGVSRTTFYAAINKLDKFDTYAARWGIEKAKRKFRIVGEGLVVTRPGERIEMDEWTTQLHVLFCDAGVWELLTKEQKEAVLRVRLVVCIAICATTRCVLGLHLSLTASSANALAALEMVTMDKGRFADAVGALEHWHMRLTPETIATDGGPSFFADVFRIAVLGLTGTRMIPPVGNPELRGRLERMFSTAHVQLTARFTGRTFEHVVAKGDYNSEKRASAVAEALAWSLFRYVIDLYHNTPHEGLGCETPRECWNRLATLVGFRAPPDRTKRRHIFGMLLSRTITNRGVRVAGIHYQSAELQAHLRHTGESVIDVKVDLMDLGAVSIRLGGFWHSAEPSRGKFDGVTMATWLAAAQDIRNRNLDRANLSLPVAYEAIRAISALSEYSIGAALLGSTRPSSEQIDAAERDLFHDFEFLPDGDEDEPQVIQPHGADPFNASIPAGESSAKREPPGATPHVNTTDPTAGPDQAGAEPAVRAPKRFVIED